MKLKIEIEDEAFKKGLSLLQYKSDFLQIKKNLLKQLFNGDWDINSFVLEGIIHRITQLISEIEQFKGSQTQIKIMNDGAKILRPELEELLVLEQYFHNVDSYKLEVETVKKEFLQNPSQFNFALFAKRELNLKVLIADDAIINNLDEFRPSMSNSQIETLVERHPQHPLLKGLIRAQPIRDYLRMKSFEESSNSSFHRWIASVFEPDTCGEAKVRVAEKISKNLENNKPFDEGLTANESTTAYSGRFFKDYISDIGNAEDKLLEKSSKTYKF